MSENKEKKDIGFLFIDLVVWIIQFFVGMFFSTYKALPFLFILHLGYIYVYENFFKVTMLDLYILILSSIVFWSNLFLKNRRLED